MRPKSLPVSFAGGAIIAQNKWPASTEGASRQMQVTSWKMEGNDGVFIVGVVPRE